MKHLRPILCVLVIMFGLNISNVFSQTVDTNSWDGKIYFKIKNSSFTEVSEFRAGDSYSDAFFSALITKYSITDIFKPFPRLLSSELQKTYQINFTKKDSVLMLIADLQASNNIEYAEKIPIEKILTIPPLDPFYTAGSQWSLNQINAIGAWNIHPATVSTGYFNNSVIVAVVDNEVLTSHEDLFLNLWINTGELGGDEDLNGYIGDFNGWDSGDNDGNPNPPSVAFDHGTHVSGVAVGSTDNGFGISSLSWNVRLMAIKATSDFASPGTLTNPWGGVSYAIENGANVINMSWGGLGSSITCQNIINYGSSLGIIFVAAAGNSDLDLAITPFFPAMYNNVITVGSTGTTIDFDEKSTFSNYGVGIDVMAPGWNIVSSISAGTTSYGFKNGTSMASPLVASLCGLMKSYNPFLTDAEIINCITTTCDNISAIASNGSYPGQLGAGRINAQAALQCLLTSPNVAFSSSGTNVCPGGTIDFYDNSTGATATAWNWTFPGGTPGTSTSPNPTGIIYNTPGIYSVTLTVTNAFGTNTLTQSNYIVVSGSCSIADVSQGNWYFGKKAGISFASGSPVAVNDAVVNNTINSDESTVSISDPVTGNLLFYSDAVNVWDGNHVLITSGLTGHSSRSQILAVPNPDDANQYFLFHSPESGPVVTPPDFIYSIIDVTGGVITVPTMNAIIPLPAGVTTISEHLTAVPHCNGRDYWIIVHGHNRSNTGVSENYRFYIYLLSPFGLTNRAMSAPTPDSYTFPFLRAPTLGELKASPDGTKLALAGWGGGGWVGLYDFNNSTGLISNENILATGTSYYGCAFDPTGSFLYASTYATNSIFAWELANLSAGAFPITTASGNACGMQLGPNDIIYVARNGAGRYVGAINPPYNTVSTYVPTAVDLRSCTGCLAAGVTSRLELPNFIGVPKPPLTNPAFTFSVQADCSTVDFSSSCYGNYIATWDFGDATTGSGPNVTHTYAATGTYTVTLTLTNSLETLVVNQTITIINPTSTFVINGPNPTCFDNISPDDYFINPISGATYNWTVTNGTIISPDPLNSNLISINWTSAGTATITVSVTIGACTSAISSINVIVNPLPVISIVPTSPTICMGGSTSLTASGAGTGTYTWSPTTGLSCPTCASTIANPTSTTTYTVTGIDANGCSGEATVTVTVSSSAAPTVTVNSPTICAGQSGTLSATVSPTGGTFSWSPTTGLGCTTCASTSANPTSTTTYTVTYTLGGCSNIGIGTVTVNPLPTVTFGPIPNSCSGGTPVTLTTGSPSGGSYSGPFVSGGVFTPPTVTTSTSYTLTYTYTDAGTLCVNSATQTITVDPCIIPCSGCTYTLDALAPLGILSVSPTQYRVYCLNSDITISGTVTIALSEIRIAPTVTITVDPGSTLNIYGSHLYSCSDMWQGIVVKPGGRINVLYYATILTPGPGLTKRSPLIEDARIAIDIQAGSTITVGYILNVRNATFNRNECAIKINGYISPISAYPFIFENSVFTCRDIPFSPFSINWPLTNTVKATYTVPTPLQTPYINTGTFSESNAASYLKPPFIPFPSPAASKSKVAIALNGVGDVAYSGATPSAWYEIKIGTIGMPAKFNVFDNHVICIDAVNSNFTCVNNVFQNTIGSNNAGGIAINALAKALNYRAQVIAGTPTGSFNNKFYDCNRSINTSNYFENTFKYCDVRSTPLSPTSQRGKDGFYVVTNRFRVVNMSDNKFYNIENAITFNAIFGVYNINGVYFSPSTGGQYSGQVNVDRNEIAPHLPSNIISTQFVRSAIVLGNSIASGIQLILGNTVTASSNNISKVHKGILTTSWFQKNIITNSNTITLVTDPFSGTATQFGVQHTNNTGATTYGNSINGNSVTGTGIFTNSNVRGVYTARCNKERVACNVVNGTTHGIQFASGHLNTKFDNNSMTNHMYGYVLSDNGIIDWQGSLSSPADNTWSGAWTGFNFKTATLSGSSAQFSKMYVRNGGLFNPNGSGFAASGLYGVEDYFYSGTSGTLLYVPTTTPPSLGCAVIVGGGGGGGIPGSAIALLEDIAQDNISHANNDAETKYINKNQLYRLLKADPSLTSSSVVLQNFYIASIPTVRETFASIEDDIASGDLVNGQSKTNALAPVNSIEDNYKTFFNAYLKYQTDTILSGDSIAIVNMANACPFTDGDVVYQARVLYNSIYSTNIYFEDNCPEVTERSFDQIKDKTTSSFDVLLYPNPNTGDFSLVPFSSDITELNITVMDVNGKIIFTKTINSGDRLFNLSLDSPNGIYMMFVNNPHTNESIVKRIVIQK